MVKKMSELAKMAMSEREMNSFAGGETCGLCMSFCVNIGQWLS